MMDIDEPMDSQEISDMATQSQQQKEALVFTESLLGRNKALKLNDLLNLLKALHEQLKEMDQNVDLDSLDPVRTELIHEQILKHKNSIVKAIAACCIADVIRLYAPEEHKRPYETDQLKDIFVFFIEQLSFTATESPDFDYHFYLLENLQSVKTFLLLSEIDSPETVALPLVDHFFKITEKAILARNVELCMTDVLIQILEDVKILGTEITEYILEQFEKFDKGSNNPAYLMALDICYTCPNILQRKVCQHFSEILLSVSNSTSETIEHQEFEDVKKCHNLIRKVHAVTPELLLNVLPLLQEEMKFDILQVRQLAVETMGEMFAEPSSTVATSYPLIWKTWIGRRDDKAIQIRVKWLEMCVDIYKNHPTSASELITCFKEKLADPDEKVRATVCKVLGEVGMENNLRALDRALLKLIADRTKDKKSIVRTEAMNTIGSIYQNCFSAIQASDKLTIEKVGWIPDTIISRLYVGDLSVTVALESALHQFILPQIDNDVDRTERLITIVDSLEPKQSLAFTALLRKQKAFNDHMHTYVKMCEDHMDNADMSEHEMAKNDEFMKYMAAFFPDKARTLNALRSFLNIESEKDIKQLRYSIDLNRTYKQICAAKSKLISSLNEDQPAILDIFHALLNRSCPLILSKSNVPALLKTSKAQTSGRETRRDNAATMQRAAIAQELLKEMSTTFPTMYNNNMKDILQDIMDDNDGSAAADESLELLSQISKAHNGEMVFADNVKERLMDYVANGNPTQAEYAATALANMKNASTVLAELARDLVDELFVSDANLLTNLTSLAQFALYAPDLISPSIDTIIRFIESDLLPAKTTQFRKANNDWELYEDLPLQSQQKLTGIRLLVNYLTACKETEGPEEYVIKKIFSIFWDMLGKSCDAAVADKCNSAEASQLRLAGTQAIVVLTTYPKYMSELTIDQFENLSETMQDSCFYVRVEFTNSLIKGLSTGQIHPRYYTLLFLLAHEVEESLLKTARTFVKKKLSIIQLQQHQEESSVLDSTLVRLVHLLAHHPDFSVAVEDLTEFANYLRFYISCVATQENVSFLYHILQKIKLSKDNVNEELSQNSYVLAELGCYLIKQRCKEAHWSLAAYEGRVSLQSRLYRTLPVGAVQTETMKNNYLPDAFLKYLEEGKKLGDKRQQPTTTTASKRVKA